MDKKAIDNICQGFMKKYPKKYLSTLNENKKVELYELLAKNIWPIAHPVDERDEQKVIDYVYKKVGILI